MNPISDAPILTVGDSSVSTQEDTLVPLGFNAPQVKDSVDQNDTEAGDFPERLGAITLSGIPEGAIVYKQDSSGAVLTQIFTGSSGNDSFTVILSDATGTDNQSIHYNGAHGDVELTAEEFEGLQILPPPDDADDFGGGPSQDNFTVTMRVTEYEVDENGLRVNAPDTNGQTSETSVLIDVTAVTDRVDLRWTDASDDPSTDSLASPGVGSSTVGTDPEDGTLSKWIDEDESFLLSDLLEYSADDPDDYPGQNGDDADGSEDRTLVISGLPYGSNLWIQNDAGSWVEVTPDSTTGAYSIDIPSDTGTLADLPDIKVQPPSHFSGDIEDVTITLNAKDTDADSTVTTGTKLDFVKLNLYVNPLAEEHSDLSAVTREDRAVKFLAGLDMPDSSSDPSNGGEEVIDYLTVRGIPAGWEVFNAAGQSVLLTSDGTAFSFEVPSSDLSGAYKAYTLLPPAHSSFDADLSVDLKVIDTSTVNSDSKTDTLEYNDLVLGAEPSLSLNVKVTPVAERLDTDSDEDGETDLPLSDVDDTDKNSLADLQMNESFAYGETPAEDSGWFDLHNQPGVGRAGSSVLDLVSPWSNEDDSSEQTYARFSGVPAGSMFRYNDGTDWIELPVSGDNSPVDVPVEYLNTIQFKPPEHASGDFDITVRAKTVDTDEDAGDMTTDTAISGEVHLTISYVPVPDQITIQASSPGGLEDNVIPLHVRVQSDDTDGSETFTVTFKDFPAGHKLFYDGDEQQPDVGGDIVISDFDNDAVLGIQPPDHSNLDIVNTLTVEAYSSDNGVIGSVQGPVPLVVEVTGVADGATFANGDPLYSEADMDDNSTYNSYVSLQNVITDFILGDDDTGNPDYVSGDYSSETPTLQITGLDERFSVEGGSLLPGEWGITSLGYCNDC